MPEGDLVAMAAQATAWPDMCSLDLRPTDWTHVTSASSFFYFQVSVHFPSTISTSKL